MFEYAHKNQPVPTQNLQVVRPDYKKIEEEIRNKILVKTEIVGDGENAKTVNYFEDQKIMKYTNWNNEVIFSAPIVLRSYTEEIKTKVDVKFENKCKIGSNRTGNGENEKQIDIMI